MALVAHGIPLLRRSRPPTMLSNVAYVTEMSQFIGCFPQGYRHTVPGPDGQIDEKNGNECPVGPLPSPSGGHAQGQPVSFCQLYPIPLSCLGLDNTHLSQKDTIVLHVPSLTQQ